MYYKDSGYIRDFDRRAQLCVSEQLVAGMNSQKSKTGVGMRILTFVINALRLNMILAPLVHTL